VTRRGLFIGAAWLCGCAADGGTTDGAMPLTDPFGADARITDARSSAEVPVARVLGETPLLRLGEADGDEPYMFSGIGDVVVLSSGDLVVVNRREIRVFSPRGAHLRTMGGAGQGPGEFQSIDRLARFGGDTLMAWDGVSRRLTVLTPEGGVERTHALQVEPGPTRASVAVASDGTVLIAVPVASALDLGSGEWMQRSDSLALRRFENGEESPEEVARHAGTDRASRLTDFGDGRIAISNPELPFGFSTHLSAWGDRFVVARNSHFVLHVHDRTGTRLDVWRMPGLEEPLTPDEVARYRARMQEVGASTGEMTSELLDRFGAPSQRPAFDALLPSSSGELWLRRFRSDPGQEQTWWLVASDGELAGKVLIPAHLELRAVEAARVIALARDELDVQRIEVYELAPAEGL
jgi:hypothetical protein